jgi:C-terminal processing protease CtpA/Prc
MSAAHRKSVRLLPIPSEGPRASQAAQEPEEDAGTGIIISLAERAGPDAGPVVVSASRDAAAGIDGILQAGDRLVSVDGEPVRSWSMAKVQRVIDSKSGKQISLELDRNGKKFVASLSPRHVHVVSTRGEAAIDVGTPEGKYSTLSMSSLNDPDTPFVNRVGTGSSSVKVEHLQAKCKVISCCP